MKQLRSVKIRSGYWCIWKVIVALREEGGGEGEKWASENVRRSQMETYDKIEGMGEKECI